ncbi:hypothetical protein AAVH_09382 [Aphelenchoides avenae]|nr:hypothetical protein AAVH_09382 [Aphelenchus avenae]
MRFNRFNCFGTRNGKTKLVLLKSRYSETSELFKKNVELEGKLQLREAEIAELRRQIDVHKRKEIVSP